MGQPRSRAPSAAFVSSIPIATTDSHPYTEFLGGRQWPPFVHYASGVPVVMTYQKYWSLGKLPFGRPESADDFFAGRPQREALARFDYLVRGSQSSGLLIGSAGVGQTTLLRRVALSSGFGDCAVDIVYTGAKDRTRDELLRQLAVRLGTQRLAIDTYRQIAERIRAAGRQRVRTVWLIDDCTTAAAETASALSTDCPWFTVVAGCTPERALKVAAGLGGCSLRIDVEPFELSDSAAFVRHQLVAAGGEPDAFTDAALIRLHELSEGRVARLAKLAELCLPVGASHSVSQIHVDIVEAIQYEVVTAAAA